MHFYGNEFAHALALHRDAVQNVGDFDGALVVGDHDELRPAGHFANEVVEASDIGVVERRIDLVEQEEWRGPNLEYGNQQRDCGQRLLATREQVDVLEALAGRHRHDLDTRLENVVGFGQRQARAAAVEQTGKVLRETLADLFEGLLESTPTGAVDPLDGVAKGGERAIQVVLLLREKSRALAQFFLLLDRTEVHFTQTLDLAADLFEPLFPLFEGKGREQRILAGVARGIGRSAFLFVVASRFGHRFERRSRRLLGFERRGRRLLGCERRGRRLLGFERRGRRFLNLHVPFVPDRLFEVRECEFQLAAAQLRLVDLATAIRNLASKLADTFGKEVAERIKRGEGKPAGLEGDRVLSGEDLTIGGEWAKNLYDVMVPSAMKRFGKQWGAEVGETEVPSEAVWIAEAYPDLGPQATQRFQSMPITPEMRRSVVEKGVPKFAAERIEGAVRRAIGLREMRAALPGAKFARHERGTVATLPGGTLLLVEPDATIVADPTQFEAAYRRAFDPKKEFIAGTFEKTPSTAIAWDGVVQLSGNAPAGTAFHESFHAAMGLALSEKQRAAVLKQYGTEEKAADAYSKWTPKTPHGAFAQIRKFFERIYRAFRPSAESAFEAVQTGKVWEGRGAEGARGPPRFAAAPETAAAINKRMETLMREHPGVRRPARVEAELLRLRDQRAETQARERLRTAWKDIAGPGAEPNALAYVPRLRQALADVLPGERFDQHLLDMQREGVAQLQAHPTPSQLTAAERSSMIQVRWNAKSRRREIDRSPDLSETEYLMAFGYLRGQEAAKFAVRQLPEPTGELGPDYMRPVDPDVNRAKVERLAKAMRKDGWAGPPVLAIEGTHDALTGSHRIAAAKAAELDVPVFEVPLEDITAGMKASRGVDPFEIRDLERLDWFRQAAEKTGLESLAEATKLMEVEEAEYVPRDQKVYAVAPIPKPEAPPGPLPEPLAEGRATGRPPRVEARVESLRKAEKQASALPYKLAREDRQRWVDLDPDIRELVATKEDSWFYSVMKRRRLTAPEVQAWDMRVRGKAEAMGDGLSALREARQTGEGADAASRDYLASQLDFIRAQRESINDGTGAGRALAARARIMKGVQTVDDAFVRKMLKELDVTDTQAAELVRIWHEKPEFLPQFLQQAIRRKPLDKILELYKGNLLSAFSTDIANMTGNAVEHHTRMVETAVASGVDWALSGMRGTERERFLGEVAGEVGGTVKALGPALRQFGHDMKDVFTLKDKPIDPTGARFEHQIGAIGTGPRATRAEKVAGKVVRTSFGKLEAEDMLWQALGGGAELGKLARRKAETELRGRPKAEIQERSAEIEREVLDADNIDHIEIIRAVAEAKEARTFRDKPWDAVQSLINISRRHPSLQAVFPFIKTPGNLARLAVQRSPAGFVRAAKVYQKFLKGEASQGDLSDAIARPLLGTTILAAFATYAMQGGMTGGGPTDWKEKSLLRDTGWQPYSFVFEDEDGKKHYIPFNRFDPISAVLGFAADVAEMPDRKDAGDMFDKALASITENLTSKTYLKGLGDASALISDPRVYASRYVSGMVGGFLVPNIVARGARAIDPVVRETRPAETGFGGIPEKVGKVLMSRIPGVSRRLEPRISGTGAPVERVGAALSRFAFPVQESVEREGREVEKLLLDIGYTPSPPSRTVTIPGTRGKGKVRLGEREYAYLVRAREQAAERVRKALRSPGFRRLDPEEQRKRIESLFSRASSDARKRLMPRLRRRFRGAQP